MFEPFLKFFQTEPPVLPHMNGDRLELIKSILKMCIKSEAIEACSNLTKIDLHNKEIQLKLSQIDIAFDVKELKIQCINILISAVEKLFERCPLNFFVVRMSTCILSNSLAQTTHEAKRNQMNLLHHIISLGILTPSFSDSY